MTRCIRCLDHKSLKTIWMLSIFCFPYSYLYWDDYCYICYLRGTFDFNVFSFKTLTTSTNNNTKFIKATRVQYAACIIEQHANKKNMMMMMKKKKTRREKNEMFYGLELTKHTTQYVEIALWNLFYNSNISPTVGLLIISFFFCFYFFSNICRSYYFSYHLLCSNIK